MREIGREEVLRLVAAGAQVVDVLPDEEYAEEHLRGALHIPLGELGRRARHELRRDRPVVVYCFDLQCDLSPRAAWRLERLGFDEVYDYAGGRMDWAAAGLPVEGTASAEQRIGDVAHRDVPRCAPDDRVGEVARSIGEWELAVVVDERGVVLGVVRSKDADADSSDIVEGVMTEGPSTYRPNVSVEELRERFDKHDVSHALVSDNTGRLIGLVRRDDLG